MNYVNSQWSMVNVRQQAEIVGTDDLSQAEIVRLDGFGQLPLIDH